MILHQGNCIEIIRSLAIESIDLVVCDPPYSTHRPSTTGHQKKMWGKNKSKGGFAHNALNWNEFLPLLFAALKEGSHGYLFVNEKNLVSFHLMLRNHRFKVYKTLIWKKQYKIPNNSYCTQHEYIIFFRKGRSKYINNTYSSTILEYPALTRSKDRFHPSEKPVILLRHLIENSSDTGDTVLDFAMGSGSTGVACIDCGRNFVGIEIDTQYFKVAQQRIKNEQNQQKLWRL